MVCELCGEGHPAWWKEGRGPEEETAYGKPCKMKPECCWTAHSWDTCHQKQGTNTLDSSKVTQVQRDSPCSSEKALVSFLIMRKNDIIRSGVQEGPSRTSRLFQKNLKWSAMPLMCLLGHLALSSQTETQWPSRREMLGGAVGRKLEFAVLHIFLMSKERLESCQHALRRWAHRL